MFDRPAEWWHEHGRDAENELRVPRVGRRPETRRERVRQITADGHARPDERDALAAHARTGRDPALRDVVTPAEARDLLAVADGAPVEHVADGLRVARWAWQGRGAS